MKKKLNWLKDFCIIIIIIIITNNNNDNDNDNDNKDNGYPGMLNGVHGGDNLLGRPVTTPAGFQELQFTLGNGWCWRLCVAPGTHCPTQLM